jgi:hypothetical protein
MICSISLFVVSTMTAAGDHPQLGKRTMHTESSDQRFFEELLAPNTSCSSPFLEGPGARNNSQYFFFPTL